MLILYCPFDTASASVVESVLVPVCGLVSVTPVVAVPLVAVPVLGVVAVGMFPANRMLPTVVDVAEVDTGSSVMAAALRPEKVTV
jgi:hypothetical protein